jgi:MacB-like periplasmic core domain
MSVTEVQYANWGSFQRQALERVAAIPGVQYAAFAWGVPLTGNNRPATLEIEGQSPAVKESDKTALPLRAATPDYFKLMGEALLQGREFRSTDDDKAAKVAIVNQAFADRFFPQENPVGRKFWLDGRDKPGTEIVGEIANSRSNDLTEEASPEVYLPLVAGASVFEAFGGADRGGPSRGGACRRTGTALGGSDGGDRKREDSGTDSRRIAGVADLRDATAGGVRDSGKCVNTGGNLRRAFAVGDFTAAKIGDS